MEITETKRFIPERFELATTLSLSIWSMFHDETIPDENVFERGGHGGAQNTATPQKN